VVLFDYLDQIFGNFEMKDFWQASFAEGNYTEVLSDAANSLPLPLTIFGISNSNDDSVDKIKQGIVIGLCFHLFFRELNMTFRQR